tara:strand:+ start:256 stop:474 length:219 start_codon:yes stop_codon:yes gene_type:complete
MGQVKKLIMQEEKKFWEKCDNIMKNSESILEFFGRVEASQKDGDIIRPEHISYEQFTEDSHDNWNKVWSDYN